MQFTIGTHSGPFHCDDVMAVAILTELHGRGNISVVRSRDSKVLDECQVLVDVGGEYDPTAGRFDHHQRGFEETHTNGIKYSSAGLVWKHFGKNLEGVSAEVHAEVEKQLMMPIDAADNGIALYEGGAPQFSGVSSPSLSKVISMLNPTWKNSSHEEFAIEFAEATKICRSVLMSCIDNARDGEDAAAKTLHALSNRETAEILILEQFHPWIEQAVEDEEVIFCVYKGPDSDWMIQCVPPTLGSFDKRRALPAEWAGLRAEELAAITGVADSVFCHMGRFICGAGSKEGAMRMVHLALETSTEVELH